MTKMLDIEKRGHELADFFKALREDYAADKIQRDKADSLANIGGKELKSLAMVWANRVSQHQIEKYAHYTQRLSLSGGTKHLPPTVEGA